LSGQCRGLRHPAHGRRHPHPDDGQFHRKPVRPAHEHAAGRGDDLFHAADLGRGHHRRLDRAENPAEGEMSARLGSWAGLAVALFTVVFMVAPLVLVVLFSFNDAIVMTFPLSGLTLDWYRALLARDDFAGALRNS